MQIKFECVCPTPLCSFDLRIYIIQFFTKYIIILLITFHLDMGGVGQTHSNLIYIYSGARKKGVNLTKKGVNLKFSYNK